MNIISKTLRKVCSIKRKLQEWKKRERHYSYGSENLDKTFYIISYDYDTQGLFAIVKSVLSHIMYAVDKGWIPVVDLKNHKSQYKEGDENTWELFFEQPGGFSLSDIEKSHNIIKSYYGMYPNNTYDFYVDILDYPSKYERISKIYKEYIRPNAKTLSVMNSMKKNLEIDNNTLGVLCRGTDYLLRKPHNHPRQPQPETVIHDAKKFIEEHRYDKIFVATEDAEILNLFVREFGEKLKYIDQPRIELTKDKNFISDIELSADRRYEIALNYYTALYILSNCTAIIAGRTAGTLGAVFMSEGYRYSHFYNLGYYD